MKANEAPEKIYFSGQPHLPNPFIGLVYKCADTDIEYTRTDAFIDKAWDWIEDNLLSSNQQDKSRLYFEQFKKYVKGDKA